MKIFVSCLTILAAMFAVTYNGSGQTGYVNLSPPASQLINQPLVGETRSTLGVNNLNNIYYVNQWCSKPGVLDDTCFSNAIKDIVSHTPAGGPLCGSKPSICRDMQVLVVSPGLYVFNHTVDIPFGTNISIKGEYQSGIWGSVITSGRAPVDFFHVGADNVDLQHLSFFGGLTAITLGTTLQATYDSHINWCWFNGQRAAIHIVNGGGYDLSHNTFDSGTDYGIVSNASAGDLSANNIIASDLRGYGQISTIALTGPDHPGPSYQGFTFSGIFDHSVGNSAPVSLKGVISANISGIFHNNHYRDINVVGSSGVVISNFQLYDSGQTSVSVSGSHGVQITNGVIYNSSTLMAGAPTISVRASDGTVVNGITSLNAGMAKANVGLYVDASTVGSTIYGNNLNAQTGEAYNILDPTTELNVQGNLKASKITAANGFNGTKTIGSCIVTIIGGVITSVTGC